MAADGEALVKRYGKLKADRQNFDTRWETMAPYLAPSRMGIITSYTPGDKQTAGVYDSTMTAAADTFAMFMAGRIINPADRWLSYQMSSTTGRRLDAVREWTEECRDRALLRLDRSMFYAAGPESLIDYVGFGTGFLLLDELPQPGNRTIQGFRGFHVVAEKTGRFVIAEGPDGLVDTAMREYELSARAARDQWGLEKMPENIAKALSDEQWDKPFKFLHAVYPRSTSDQQRGAGATAMPWASCWVEMQSKQIVRESGYRLFPAAVPRYRQTPGEVFGRGPGDIAFPDAWTLNTAKKMGLEDWAMKIRPPILTRHNAVVGSLRLTPGQPTLVNARGASIRDVIAPFDSGSRPEVSQIKEEELRKTIREIFYVDTIRQLLQVEKSEMTAYEFGQKLNLLFRMVATAYGRLKREWLQPIAEITFSTMYEAGDFSPPPPEIEETDLQVRVEFENPIVRAQRAGDAEAVQMYVQDLAPLAQVDPQAFSRAIRRLDIDKASAGLADIRGVPATWVRSDEELAEMDAAAAQAAQAQAEMQAALGASEVAKNAAPMVKAMQPQGAAA